MVSTWFDEVKTAAVEVWLDHVNLPMQNINANTNSILALGNEVMVAGSNLLEKLGSAFAPASAELALA